MTKGRVEAFSDGVFAIIITIMVLALPIPESGSLSSLMKPDILIGLFVYALSFAFVGIYWNNHHHMFHVTEHINGQILWANLHLLFWLSLVPFATRWVGQFHTDAWPSAIYGVVFLASGVAYLILQRQIIALQGPHSRLAAAIGNDRKGKMSAVLYAAAIGLAFVDWRLSDAIYVGVALLWLIPDSRIESATRAEGHTSAKSER
jgi:uncharacterized membrane protein